jgi:hypothetical protein
MEGKVANERRPQSRQVSPEQMAELQEMDRQWRLECMPPQVDVNGMERQCVYCKSVLNPIHNQNYDGSTGGFCSKLCRKSCEKKLIEGGISVDDATNEVDKYEDWRPKKHSPIT